MDWILRGPQMQSSFANLAYVSTDGYHILENCNSFLEDILRDIITEDKHLRNYRRSLSFGQNIEKDLIPLLLNAQDSKTIELLVQILVNLTVPIECLLSVDVVSKTDYGRQTVFEINNLLDTTKAAFTDLRVTKVILEFLKKNFDFEQSTVRELTSTEISNIGNGLLLLRNILHIPEDIKNANPNHTVQNQIVWNIFSQRIDKIMIKLMTIPEAANWSVTMVQLIALLYKDQHVGVLHKLLNSWLEASFSESSEDNESNTTPPDRDSEDSLPSTSDSDSTSDSSDASGSGMCHGSSFPEKGNWTQESSPDPNNLPPPSTPPPPPPPPPLPPPLPSTEQQPKAENVAPTVNTTKSVKRKHEDSGASSSITDDDPSEIGMQSEINEHENNVIFNSDCGYGTQIENQESVSTSSNEDEPRKLVHQKPHNPKQKPNTKVRLGITFQDRKRRKIIKRARANIINVRGLSRKIPNDEDISVVLKEFTVDFLLKGYNSLVRTLHSQILTNLQLEIDTSHFFWLVTYFLKFATQMGLELEHISSVLSFDIVAYLTAEGVNLCEQFELATKLDGNDLKPSIRRLHLVVTAIREIVQAVDVYKKLSQFPNENEEILSQLQIKMCKMEELRSLMILLLCHYNPKYHNKQYLQDLVVTNHILLIFVDSVLKLPECEGKAEMVNHIKQFATPEMMYQYGLLLEDYRENGEFVNDCVFTLMYHVGGELDSLISLFQPNILKTFTSIWQSEFEICDDWSDLVEYVINTFIKKPESLRSAPNFRIEPETFDDDSVFLSKPSSLPTLCDDAHAIKMESEQCASTTDPTEIWSANELLSLSWNYMKCKTSPDIIGSIVKIYKEGVTKSRDSVLKELFKQNLISKDESDVYLQSESTRPVKLNQQAIKNRNDDITKLCEQLIQDGKSKFLEWVQKVLLDTCHAKIFLEKRSLNETTKSSRGMKILNFGLFKKKHNDLPLVSPVSYHNLLADKSVPLIPWNFEHVSICKDLKFLQLLHKLGFHMPVDTGKVFIRIPHFWTTEYIYEIAEKILPIDTSKLNFSKNDFIQTNRMKTVEENNLSAESVKNKIALLTSQEHFYQIQKQNHLATMVNYTPMPGFSYKGEQNNIGDTNDRSWLAIVQRSQEITFTLNVKNDVSSSNFSNKESMEPVATTVGESATAAAATTATAVTTVEAPDVPSTSATSTLASPAELDVPADSSDIPMLCDDEDNNSGCETASVASNLTRMYVSDEDENRTEPGPLFRSSSHLPHYSLQMSPTIDIITEK